MNYFFRKENLFEKGSMKPVKLVESFLSSNSLKSRMLKGSMWLSMGGGAEHGLRFFRNMLLARFLAPELFGTQAIILAINAAFESFTQLGIKEAIIQNPRGREQTYLNIAWWISFVRAGLLFAAGFLLAPTIAGFYNDQSLVAYMRVSFITVLFNGAMSVRAFTMLKDMKCFRWAIVNHGGGILGVLCTIVLSMIFHNIWALVIGYVAEAGFRFILSYCLCFYFPGLKFDKNDTASLIKFSRGIFGLPIFYFIFTRTDIFVLGKLVSKASLGLYSMTAALAEIPSIFISMALSPILLPTFSKIIDDKKRLNRYLLELNTIIWVVSLPALAFIGFSGKGVLWQVYGKEYSSQAVVFFLLFSSTVCRILSFPIATLYLAVGKPELQRFFVILRAVIMVALVFPMAKEYGAPGAAASALLSNIVAYFLQFIHAYKLVGVRIEEYLAMMLKTSIVVVPVILLAIVLTRMIPGNLFYGVIPGFFGMVLSYGLLVAVILHKRVLQPQN